MYLHALSTALPPNSFTQPQCWEKIDGSALRERLSRRSMITLRALLHRDASIHTRHFALPEIERVTSFSSDELNAYFRRAAPELAGAALTKALASAGVAANELDALFVCTCTGYLCPGLSSYIAEQGALRADTFLQDLVGLGCGAAVPTLRAADAFLAANPDAVVATVAVEICSAAFYLDDDPGVLVSACLFGDGAAAAIWRGTPDRARVRVHDFSTIHQPELRDHLRFEQRDGRLRNLLHPTVPQLAAGAVQRLFAGTGRNGHRPVRRIISHPGGRDVIDALEAVLPGHSLQVSREVLRDVGNLSSPSVLFVLERALREHEGPDESGDWWLVSFGAGFSAHGCRVSRGAD